MPRLATSLGGAALAAALLASPLPAAGQARDWKEITKPPLRPFVPQPPARIALPNGMVIFLQEDHELPLVKGFARIRGGSREEPADRVGLVTIYGQVWRTGGTKTHTGDQLDDKLEARAAKVETSGGLDSTNVSFNCLKGDFDEVFAVFQELLRQPELRPDKIVIARNQLNTSIARRNDQPLAIAAREAARLGYGADSPYARVPEYATVAAVTRDDLLAWHRAHVHPNNVILGMAGDFDAKKMGASLRKAFASWPRGPAAAKAQVAFHEPKPGVYFVQKEDVNQSSIRMVHLGTTRDNPDYFALEVMNEVFGGSFAARLFSNVRSKKGLAYAVGGGVGTDFDHPGLFQVSMGTKSGTTAVGIDALYEEIDNLLKDPATPDELKRAKESILNSFVFRFDSKQKVLLERMAYEFHGYPADFLERYRAGIEKVTAGDVARVARQYVHRDRLAVLVVGRAADFDRPLSSFGPVTALDIRIPEGTKRTDAAGSEPGAAGSDAAGKAVLAKVIEGLGGAAKVQAVKSLRQKASIRAKTPQGETTIELDSVSVLPDQKMRQDMQGPMGSMVMVLSPEASFMSMPMGTRDLPASQKESAIKDLKTSPLYVAQHADDPKLSLRAGGTEKVGDVEAKVLELSLDGAEARWLVDPQTGRILRSVARTMAMGGPAEQVTDYSDFRTVDGLTFAFKRSLTRNGEDAGTVELRAVEVNPPVDAKRFEKQPEGEKK